MLRTIRKLGRRLLYGGFAGPRAYEAALLEAAVAALPGEDGDVLEEQIALAERFGRWNDDRMVIVGFSDKDAVPRLSLGEPDHCLARFRFDGDFEPVTANVMTHRGILSSLEFRPSPREIGKKEYSLRRVVGRAPDAASGVDAEEHPSTPSP